MAWKRALSAIIPDVCHQLADLESDRKGGSEVGAAGGLRRQLAPFAAAAGCARGAVPAAVVAVAAREDDPVRERLAR